MLSFLSPNKIYINGGKRFLDVLVASLLIVVFSPIFILIAMLIRISSPGPVFYVQRRVGQGLFEFNFYKFRTMVVGADKVGPGVTSRTDSRITKIGAFLRLSKLDELPQLLNVLKGDMSLIGPRPELPKYIEYFSEQYRQILRVRPGITDFATIEFRDEEDILAQYDDVEAAYLKVVLPQKLKLYEKYINGMSFKSDLEISLRTLYKIFIR